MGYTRREAVLMCYLICVALGVVALFITQASIIEGYVVGSVVALVGLWGLWRMEQVDYPGKEVRGNLMNGRRTH
jgi:UDP-GlcNAc:undecaprenyl-phosphate GlcNAc-1-phosphate transferase